MNILLKDTPLAEYINMQITNLFGESASIAPYLDEALFRSTLCYKHSKNKYYYKNNELCFSPFNSSQYSIFLYYLSNAIFQHEGSSPLADKVYYLNKVLNSVDWYYEILLPEYWGVEHPLGSVLGRANYKNGLFLYQGTTIGGNKGYYPNIGENVILYANSTVLGKSVIGNNVLISAGTLIKDEQIPDSCLVFGQSPNLTIKPREERYIQHIMQGFWV